MLIDEVISEFDAVRSEHLIVGMSIERAWEATLDADFVETATSSRLVRVLFGLRSGGEKIIQALTRKEPEPPEEIVSMRLREMGDEGEWIRLAPREPEEIVFGVIGRFWSGETVWEKSTPKSFREFDQPGFARIAANFSLREYGPERTLISYECRTQATSADARKAFLRYWRVLHPFIGMVLRAQLRLIARG